MSLSINGSVGITYPDGTVQTTAFNANTGVTSFSGGPTGLTPSVAQTGAVALAGVLNPISGGTGVASPTGIPYFNGASPLTAATAAQVATLLGTTPVTAANNIQGGAAAQIPYQTAANTTGFVAAPTTAGTVLGWNGSALTWITNGDVYQGLWNATTNTPALASGVGVNGAYYIVSVAGSTNLDGISDWQVGDWAIFDGGVWNQLGGGSAGSFDTLNVTGSATMNTSGAVIIDSGTLGSLDNVTVGGTTPAAVTATVLTANTSADLTPTGTVTVNPGVLGSIDNMAVGATTASTGRFTTLTATTSATLSPSGTVAISPTGALTVNPTAASTMNNVAIGGTTPLAGTFTALTATTSASLSPTGTVTINPTTASAMNNVAIGGTTPLAGTFTDLTATTSADFSPTGTVTIDPTVLGAIDNMDIGAVTPATGTFTDLTATTSADFSPTGTVTIDPTVLGAIDNMAIGATTASTVRGTTITATTQFTGPGTGLTGTAASLTAGKATALAGGTGANQVPYQSAAGVTTFLADPTVTGSALTFDGTNLVWGNPSDAAAIAGGAANQIPYQTAPGTTAFISAGTINQRLTPNGGGVPAWQNVSDLTFSGNFNVAGPYNDYTAVALDLLNRGITPTTYGNPIAIPVITVNAQGVITAVSEIATTGNNYVGSWDANTNTPTLADGTGSLGDYYICTVAGTTNFGSGPITFSIGDWAVYDGAQWDRVANSQATAVSSFTVTTLAAGQVVLGGGTNPLTSVAVLPSTAGGTGVNNAYTVTVLNANQSLDQAVNINATPTFTGTNFTGIPNAGLVNSSITFGATAAALGTTVSALDAVSVGVTTAAAGRFTTLAATTSANLSPSGVVTINPGTLGTVDNVTIGGTTAAAVTGTTITATTQFTGPGTGLTGTAASLTAGLASNIVGGAALQVPFQTAADTTTFTAAPTVTGQVLQYNGATLVWAAAAGTTTNVLTMDNSGTGAASGTTFNGSAAQTISYNTVGASPLAGSASLTTTGTITSGTWNGTAVDVAHGGTGVATLSGLAYGNGTSAFSAATAGQVVGVIGTNAVTNATNATAVTNSGGWSITPTGTKLYFNYNGTNVGSLDSSGNFTVTGNVTGNGTP